MAGRDYDYKRFLSAILLKNICTNNAFRFFSLFFLTVVIKN